MAHCWSHAGVGVERPGRDARCGFPGGVGPPVALQAGSQEALRHPNLLQPIERRTAWNNRGQPVKEIDEEGNVALLAYTPDGYLREWVLDAEVSPWRDPSAPPPVGITWRMGYSPAAAM